MFTSSRRMGAALILLALTACGGGNQPETDLRPEDAATLRVENQSIRDMRVYVRPNAGGSRWRVGTANGLSTTLLKIPRTLVTGVTDLIFEVSPIGGGGSGFSERITAGPGEEIVLRIPPS